MTSGGRHGIIFLALKRKQKREQNARVVELADSLDSGSSVHYARAGSSPASRTNKKALKHDSFKAFLCSENLRGAGAKLLSDENVSVSSHNIMSLRNTQEGPQQQ